MNKWIVPVLLLTATSASALDGISFRHKDWEIACDNTGTCRMAGYQAEDHLGDLLVSVLLTREAHNNAVIADFNSFPLGGCAVEENNADMPMVKKINLWIDNKDLGEIKREEKDPCAGRFSEVQTQSLLSALKGSSQIKFVATFLDKSVRENELSTQGVNAVMLKADEFQRRLNTPSALIRKGSEKGNILQPQPLPVVNVPKLTKSEIEIKPSDPKYSQILKLLKTVVAKEMEKNGCYDLYEPTGEPSSFWLHPLDSQNTLLTTICNKYAYRWNNLNVLLSPDLSKIKKVLVARGDYALNGEIWGDWQQNGDNCRVTNNWAWNGKDFKQTFMSEIMACHSFPGGAWDLPTYKSKVNNPNAN